MLLLEDELLKILVGSSRVWFSVLALVLALLGNDEKLLDLVDGDGVVTDEFVQVTVITAQVLPSKNLVAAFPDLNAEMEGFVEEVTAAIEYERSRDDMSSSKDRPGAVHHRTGEACPVCGDEIREVAYNAYTVHYCPTCQTDGKVLADNTTSKFLK
jgi:formamidopyrimidine-DNA glycosylase